MPRHSAQSMQDRIRTAGTDFRRMYTTSSTSGSTSGRSSIGFRLLLVVTLVLLCVAAVVFVVFVALPIAIVLVIAAQLRRGWRALTGSKTPQHRANAGPNSPRAAPRAAAGFNFRKADRDGRKNVRVKQPAQESARGTSRQSAGHR